MFILIFGEDAYSSWQKLKEIVEDFKKKNEISLSWDLFNFQKLSYPDFRNELRHGSMFEKRKLVVLRNAFIDSSFREEFLKGTEGLSGNEEVVVIFYEDKTSILSKDLLGFFRKHGRIYKYDLLKGVDLKNWAKKQLSNLGLKINSFALNLLVSSVGSDLWRMSAEIKKLAAYKGRGKTIEKKDIELLVKPEIETAIFKTIDAIAAKDKRNALFLIYKHLEKGDSPFYLLTMMIYQFRNLLLAKELEDRSLSEAITALKPMHPFVAKKSYYLAKKFSLEQLERIYLKIFNMDLAIKTGKIKPEMALELLIVDI